MMDKFDAAESGYGLAGLHDDFFYLSLCLYVFAEHLSLIPL
jgi:hypothetical protein